MWMRWWMGGSSVLLAELPPIHIGGKEMVLAPLTIN